MNSQSEYPPIRETISAVNSPYRQLFYIKDYPNLNYHIENGTMRIESYKKSFLGKKKILDIIIEKIDNPDEDTKNFSDISTGKIFGIIVYEKNKEIYRALYECGYFKALVKALMDKYTQDLMDITDGRESLIHLQRYSSMSSLMDIHNTIEKLFD